VIAAGRQKRGRTSGAGGKHCGVQAAATYEQELCIPAHSSELRRVRSFAAAVAAHCGFSRGERYKAMTAVHEAVASQLGSGRLDRRSVSIRALWSGGALTFWIRSSLKLEPGLGTQIMRLCARDVYVVPGQGGTTVRISI
jgi:hypothetical protein